MNDLLTLECFVQLPLPYHYTRWISALTIPTLVVLLCWMMDVNKVSHMVIFYMIHTREQTQDRGCFVCTSRDTSNSGLVLYQCPSDVC